MRNGTVVASEPNPAVSEALLKELLLWKIKGCIDDDVVIRLRQRTVPVGHKFHSWITGNKGILIAYSLCVSKYSDMHEEKKKLRPTNCDQYSFKLGKEGCQFRSHLYVPERYLLTGEVFVTWGMKGMFLRLAKI